MENWKDVVGYEGLYEVSDLGNIRSLNWGKRRIAKNLTPTKSTSGYMKVCMTKDGATRTVSVHRVVASAFIPNTHGKPLINHKDEDKTNNAAKNLEWCTPSYNVLYSMRTHPNRKYCGGKKGRKCKSKFSERKVVQMTLDGEEVCVWENVQEASKATKMSASSILQCCKNIRHKAYGFKWQFAN